VSTAVRRLLAGEAHAPVTLDAAGVTSLVEGAQAAGAHVAELRGPTSKALLLTAIGEGLRYPDWWGRNWDALAELLTFPEAESTDGAGGPAVPDVIAWHDPALLAEADPAAWEAALGILGEAITARLGRGAAPLVVAFAGDLPVEIRDSAHDSGGGHRQSAGSAAEALAAASAVPGVPPSIRRIGRVHHVAVVVRDMAAALRFWRDILGLAPGPVVPIPSDRVNIAFLPVGEVKIELVEPVDETTGVARFLASRGEGFHHVCFEVADIHAALTRLALDGIELIDSAPRAGAEGPVAFLHPRSCHGVLVELIEREGGPAWAAFYPAGFRAPGT
jgi:methylmalonyl-CoA/ethylmalonyl-CoA epimerase